MVFALIGNQNCGKTTLFNKLTGSNQHVGNFPGVTVEQKSGVVRSHPDTTLVDLPGVYSLRPFSGEELVTRDYLLQGRPDGIVNIVDATNLERSLYLTLQLVDLGLPMVMALNMMDEVRGNGGDVNARDLAQGLGMPVVPISASRGEGVEALMEQAIQAVRERRPPLQPELGSPPLRRCRELTVQLVREKAERAAIPTDFAASKLLERDEPVQAALGLNEGERNGVEQTLLQLERELGMESNEGLVTLRYRFIESLCDRVLVQGEENREQARTRRLDYWLTHRYLGIPIFLGVMLLVFWLTFRLIGTRLSDLLGLELDRLSGLVDGALTRWEINPAVHSLVVDGIFTGVGSVLSFLPIILTLFFLLSILEDSGYMARVAFLTDKLLQKIGLSGRSFVPMLIGFGCTVPAVMATRTLSSERDRRMTVLLLPFMSCSAKLPIYAVFTAAFFREHQALVMIALYLLGIGVGIVCALLLRNTAFSGDSAPFVMELPSYRFPSARSVLLLIWDRAKDFLQRAFTVILVASLIIWFLQSFNYRFNLVEDSSSSLLATLGYYISPLFAPLGLRDWRMTTALITGFTAKEMVVSTLAVLTGSTAAELSGTLSGLFTPLTAASFLTFTLLYTPCIAAIAAVNREMNARYAALVAGLQCGVAWVVAAAVYQLGSLLGLG